MANIAVSIVAGLLVALGVVAWVLRHRRADRGSPPAAQHPTAVAAREAADGERQQRLLETAFLADVPAVWYRQQMAAIAAGTEQHHPSP